MSDMLLGFVGFVIKNFFLIVGIGVLISVVCAIKGQSAPDAILHRGTSLSLLAVFLLHSFFYWADTSDPDLFVYLVDCVLPAFMALFAGGMVHDSNPTLRKELTVVAIVYAVSFLLASLFESWIVSIISAAVGAVVVFVVLSNIGKSQLMDYHTNDELGDSEVVQDLYREGYRPTNYRDPGKKGQKVRDNLRKHGIDIE